MFLQSTELQWYHHFYLKYAWKVLSSKEEKKAEAHDSWYTETIKGKLTMIRAVRASREDVKSKKILGGGKLRNFDAKRGRNMWNEWKNQPTELEEKPQQKIIKVNPRFCCVFIFRMLSRRLCQGRRWWESIQVFLMWFFQHRHWKRHKIALFVLW